MTLKKGYRLLITEAFYHWYRTETPTEGRREYFDIGDMAVILKPDEEAGYWLLQSLDNKTYGDAINQIAPHAVVEEMRSAYLNRNTVQL